MKKLLLAIAVLALTGCATSGDYKAYADAQIAIASAQAAAETERWHSIALVAQSGDVTAKVAAMMAMQAAGRPQGGADISAPKSWDDKLLQWAGVLVSPVVHGYGIHENSKTQMEQSRNATVLGISTNATMSGIAGHIQAPGAVTTINATSGSFNPVAGSFNPVGVK